MKRQIFAGIGFLWIPNTEILTLDHRLEGAKMLVDMVRKSPARDEGVFTPEDLSILRVALDVAWNGLPLKSRTTDNREVLAVSILRLATNGDRDPARLAAEAAKTLVREESRGVL